MERRDGGNDNDGKDQGKGPGSDDSPQNGRKGKGKKHWGEDVNMADEPRMPAPPASFGPTTTSVNLPPSSSLAANKTPSSSSNHQTVTILAVLSGVFALLIVCLSVWLIRTRRRKKNRVAGAGENWHWFDRWRARQTVPSMDDKDAELQGDKEYFHQPDKMSLADGDFDEVTSFRRPTEAWPGGPTSMSRFNKFRAVSIGGTTIKSGTTSGTKFVIVAPPPIVPRQSSHSTYSESHQLPQLGYYEPPSDRRPTPRPAHDVLRTAGIRNAERMLSRYSHSMYAPPGRALP